MTATHEGSGTSGRRRLGLLNERGGPYSTVRGKTNAQLNRTVFPMPPANDRFPDLGRTPLTRQESAPLPGRPAVGHSSSETCDPTTCHTWSPCGTTLP